jgi:hypothetical protein
MRGEQVHHEILGTTAYPFDLGLLSENLANRVEFRGSVKPGLMNPFIPNFKLTLDMGNPGGAK